LRETLRDVTMTSPTPLSNHVPRQSAGNSQRPAASDAPVATTTSHSTEQVCIQLPTSADKVALPASAAIRRAAARLLLTAGPLAVQKSIDIS